MAGQTPRTPRRLLLVNTCEMPLQVVLSHFHQMRQGSLLRGVEIHPPQATVLKGKSSSYDHNKLTQGPPAFGCGCDR
jgi:hypothetical protein